MLKVRFIAPESPGQWAFISAPDYDPDIHKGHIVCAHPGCTAPMQFRKGEDCINGGEQGRQDHFTSVKDGRRLHIDNCPALEFETRWKRVESGLRHGGNLLVNLNLLGKNDYFSGSKLCHITKRFNAAGLIRAEDWKQSHILFDQKNYTTFAANNIENVCQFLEQISVLTETMGSKVKQHVSFSHGGIVQNFGQTVVTGGWKDLTGLQKDIDRNQRSYILGKDENGIPFGFPRIIKGGIPYDLCRDDTLCLKEFTFVRDHVSHSLEIQTPLPATPEFMDRFATAKTFMACAIPHFEDGRTCWTVSNPAQFLLN